jgi:hypothetical protein
VHRKAHYNEFKMAQLLKSQLRDDDDDEDQDDNDEKEAEDKNTKNVNKQEVAVEKDDEKGNEDHQMESS